MRVLRRFAEEKNFMMTWVSGEVNDKHLRQHVSALNRASDGLTGVKHLVDFRGASCTKRLKVCSAKEYAQSEPARPDSSLALIIPDCSRSSGLVKAYQMSAGEKRKNVEVFSDVHSAMVWLFSHSDQIEDVCVF